METVLDRFLRYVKIDTESAFDKGTIPSTENQKAFAALLADELKALGATEVFVSEAGCVYAKIPANCGAGAPAIGFCAHIDTTPEFNGHGVKPRVVRNYNGGDILLNEEKNIVMKTEVFPHLKNYIGDDIVVTDGTTLLGADDKAGVAEIMTMLQHFHERPEEKHPELQLFFPTDEETGCLGAQTLDKERFNPQFAYTLDGGPIGEITYETFNAAEARVSVRGISIHPGLAKDKMKNSILIANEFLNMLPAAETPGHTEKYEGYYHILEFRGDVEFTNMKFYIRDHDRAKFEARKERVGDIATYLGKVYGDDTVTFTVSDTYKNIGETIRDHFEIVEAIEKAMKLEGIIPFYAPMRGGTDGTVLSFQGIPCPNICVGGHNFHGRYEYVSVQSMEKISAVLVNIVKSFAK